MYVPTQKAAIMYGCVIFLLTTDSMFLPPIPGQRKNRAISFSLQLQTRLDSTLYTEYSLQVVCIPLRVITAPFILPFHNAASRIEMASKTKYLPCSKITYGHIFCDSRKICTMNSFSKKKFERRDDSKLHLCIEFCWLLTTTKKSRPSTPKSQIFATFMVFWLPE